MKENYIFDKNNNLILENNDYIVGDIIVLDNKDEYEITFVDYDNNLAYAEFNGSYENKNFSSRYLKNVIIFSILFILVLIGVFSLALFYKLKLRKRKKYNL